ncbi:MAG: shikimate dehydrogenase, partial [Duncaniella sp.]|nr:shikimate dehydrogenase [Duncaniella sp.]
MDIYGIIGYPLGHSFSAKYFNDKFAAEGIDAEYVKFELQDIGDLMELVAETPDLAGLNVTIPYKQQVMPYL